MIRKFLSRLQRLETQLTRDRASPRDEEGPTMCASDAFVVYPNKNGRSRWSATAFGNSRLLLTGLERSVKQSGKSDFGSGTSQRSRGQPRTIAGVPRNGR
jgi:hypothetical protein